MLLPTILFLTASVTAWTVPEYFGNGVYEVPSSPDVTPLVSKPSSAKFPRGLQDLTGPNSIYCANVNLNNVDTDRANSNIDAQCGNGNTLRSSENGRDKYAISGNVVAYVCNYAGGTNNCYASERQDASNKITAMCTPYIAGDDTVPDRSNCYGFQERDTNFCGRGINGKD